MDLKFYQEGIFEKPVDVVMEKTLKPRLKKTILQDTLYVQGWKVYIEDVVASIEKIELYLKNETYEDFFENSEKQDTVTRNLEIIGEAAGKVPETIRGTYRTIEWRKIVALRNLLIHEYFGVSTPMVWDIVRNKLTPLKKACLDLVNDE